MSLFGLGSRDPGATVQMRCGGFRALFSGGSVRNLTWMGNPLVQAMYLTVRDRFWHEVDPSDYTYQYHEDGLEASISLWTTYQRGEIDLTCWARVRMRSTGEFSFASRFISGRQFLRNRLGICALLDMDLAGLPIRVTDESGPRDCRLPLDIHPLPVVTNVKRLSWSPRPLLGVTLDCDGELFEMEDQRNWTDPSFKLYPTPLSLPRPVLVGDGEVIVQRIGLKVEELGSAGWRRRTGSTDSMHDIDLEGGFHRLPSIGALLPHSANLDQESQTVPDETQLGHVLVETAMSGLADALDHLSRWHLHSSGSLILNILTDFGAADAAILGANAEALRALGIDMIGLYDSSSGSTKVDGLEGWLSAAGMRPDIRICGGTLGHYAQWNRGDFHSPRLQCTSYGICPQVHARDLAALRGAIRGVRATVQDCRHKFGASSLHLGPVGLHPRFNADFPIGASNPLRGRADPLQSSTLLAVWSLGVIAAALTPPVEWITLFEVSGARGISMDGDLFPVGRFLARLAGFRGARACRLTLAGSEYVVGIAICDADVIHMWIGNLDGEDHRVRIQNRTVLRCSNLAGGMRPDWVDVSPDQDVFTIPRYGMIEFTTSRHHTGVKIVGHAPSPCLDTP